MKIFKNHLTKSQATDLFKKIKSQTNPDIVDIKRLVNFHKASIGTKDETQALDLKYRAMTYVPTVLEKTMTPAQLYDAGCPLWAIKYSIKQLSYYISINFESATGAQIIQYMDNDIIPRINLKDLFKTNDIFGNLSPNSIIPHQACSSLASPRKNKPKNVK